MLLRHIGSALALPLSASTIWDLEWGWSKWVLAWFLLVHGNFQNWKPHGLGLLDVSDLAGVVSTCVFDRLS
jgi:hypothetical protein